MSESYSQRERRHLEERRLLLKRQIEELQLQLVSAERYLQETESKIKSFSAEYLNSPSIRVLEIDTRHMNALVRSGIKTVFDLKWKLRERNPYVEGVGEATWQRLRDKLIA